MAAKPTNRLATTFKSLWDMVVCFCKRVPTRVALGIVKVEKFIKVEICSIPKIRQWVGVLAALCIPGFTGLGFGVLEANPMTEVFHATIWFSLAALYAGICIAVMKDIRPPKVWARALVICALEIAVIVSLHYSLKWVLQKADDFAFSMMIKDASDSRLMGMENKWNQVRPSE